MMSLFNTLIAACRHSVLETIYPSLFQLIYLQVCSPGPPLVLRGQGAHNLRRHLACQQRGTARFMIPYR